MTSATTTPSLKQGKLKHERGKERKTLERSLPGIVQSFVESETTEGDDELEQRMIEMNIEISLVDELQMFDANFPERTNKTKTNKPRKVKKKKIKVTENDQKEIKEKPKSQIQSKLRRIRFLTRECTTRLSSSPFN